MDMEGLSLFYAKLGFLRGFAGVSCEDLAKMRAWRLRGVVVLFPALGLKAVGLVEADGGGVSSATWRPEDLGAGGDG